MRKSLIATSAIACAMLVVPATSAQQNVIREVWIQPIATPDTAAHQQNAPDINNDSVRIPIESTEDAVADFKIYPVAGVMGRDVLVPFFVDLQPGTGLQDYNCTNFTFEGHLGHDPYIRSFREMDIGWPVYAAQDGTVGETHDGEDDHNTNNDPNAKPNFVVINHGPVHTSQYYHLKKGSIRVKTGDFVTAGTQIAEIGSSGMSIGPHIHFEAIYNGKAYEPLAGPCRPGRSNFQTQPAMTLDPVVMGVALSNQPFDNFRKAPFDDAPRTGTFLAGVQRLNLKMEIASVPANSLYEFTMITPTGQTYAAGTGRLAGYEVNLASFGFGMDLDLRQTGTYTLAMRIAGKDVIRIPFTVVGTSAELVNHAPNAISPSLEPVGVRDNEVAVCRVEGAAVADPDFDVVSYHYVWAVNDGTVRDVTTAARSDVLARQFVKSGTKLTCSVTASDGNLSTQTVTARADVGVAPKRRAASRR